MQKIINIQNALLHICREGQQMTVIIAAILFSSGEGAATGAGAFGLAGWEPDLEGGLMRNRRTSQGVAVVAAAGEARPRPTEVACRRRRTNRRERRRAGGRHRRAPAVAHAA